MSREALDRGWEMFRASAFRLETLQVYAVPEEDPAWRAFVDGRPLPHRSVETSPWLRQIEEYTAEGRRLYTVHIVDRPLTPYLRFELAGYEGNAAAGQEIYLAERDAHPEFADWHRDWWLFDDDYLVLMEYGDDGRFLGAKEAPAGTDLREYRRRRDLAVEHAVPLADFLTNR